MSPVAPGGSGGLNYRVPGSTRSEGRSDEESRSEQVHPPTARAAVVGAGPRHRARPRQRPRPASALPHRHLAPGRGDEPRPARDGALRPGRTRDRRSPGRVRQPVHGRGRTHPVRPPVRGGTGWGPRGGRLHPAAPERGAADPRQRAGCREQGSGPARRDPAAQPAGRPAPGGRAGDGGALPARDAARAGRRGLVRRLPRPGRLDDAGHRRRHGPRRPGGGVDVGVARDAAGDRPVGGGVPGSGAVAPWTTRSRTCRWTPS